MTLFTSIVACLRAYFTIRNMARFVQISDDDVERFNEEHENENTRKNVLRHKSVP